MSHQVDYDGYTTSDRGLFRTLQHNACGRLVTFTRSAEVTAAMVADHGCGPIGTGWGRDPVLGGGPGPAHALLLRSVAAEVATVGIGAYTLPEVATAAGELAELLESQLQGAEIATGIRDPQPGDPRYIPVMHARRIAGRLEPDEPVYVTLGELVERFALPDRGYSLDHGPAHIAAGISWPEWEQCAYHAVADLTRTTQVLDAATFGHVLYAVDLEDRGNDLACASCAAETTTELEPVDDVAEGLAS